MAADGDHGPVDYSDFEYQHVQANLQIGQADADNGVRNVSSAVGIEPLEDKAGLDVNEVAELVYFELVAGVEYEAESDNLTASSSTEFRGVFGINLRGADSEFIDSGSNRAGTTERFALSDDAGSSVGHSKTDDAVLQPFVTDASPAFDDDVNGSGGGAGLDHFHTEKAYRNMVGRGPVIDSNDELSFVMRLVAGDSNITETGRVRATLVWDTMETDDAGRRFSVPS
jgi:hypothetical protein